MADGFQRLQEFPISENERLIPWLVANIHELDPRYLFELARRVCYEDEHEGMVWFWLGSLRMRYDAFRCTDKSVRDVVSTLPSIAENVIEAINADRDAARSAAFEALKREEGFPADTSPQWLVGHGIDTYLDMVRSMEEDREARISNWCIPEREWPAVREDIRKKAAESFSKLGR